VEWFILKVKDGREGSKVGLWGSCKEEDRSIWGGSLSQLNIGSGGIRGASLTCGGTFSSRGWEGFV